MPANEQPDPEKPSPFNELGEMNPAAWINIAVALLMKAGGRIEITYDELDASNKRQFTYERTDTGLAMSLIDEREGSA